MSPLRRRTRPVVCAVLLAAILAGCSRWSGSLPEEDPFYRDAMRDLVITISEAARHGSPGFLIVPQNGEQLLTAGGDPNGRWISSYADAVDGLGREDLLFGYVTDDQRTPAAVRESIAALLDMAEDRGIEVLVIDYCSTPAHVAASYAWSASRGYVSFASPDRGMDQVPVLPESPFRSHTEPVDDLSGVANFLCLLDPGRFSGPEAYLSALRATDYDLLILDLYHEDGRPLTPSEVESLKAKASGGRRKLLAYMSIGEAEAYRDYWREAWFSEPPPWLLEENPAWAENYRVRYWDPAWQEILVHGEASYLQRILDAGFDGVYLDLVDAYEAFESAE